MGIGSKVASFITERLTAVLDVLDEEPKEPDIDVSDDSVEAQYGGIDKAKVVKNSD